MTKEEQIREALRHLASQVGPAPTMIGKVIIVDEENQTCVLKDDEVEFPDVRLRPVLNGNKSIVLLPKVQTFALAVRIEKTEEWMVVACDEVSKVQIQIGELKFQMEDKFSITKVESSLYDIIKKIIEATMQIVVNSGTSPDYAKLTEATLQLENLME